MNKIKLLFYLCVLIYFSAREANAQNLIDDISQKPKAAYSTRILKKDYSGPVMQVRRSSDNQLVDVYFDASGKLSLKSPVSVEGGGVATKLILENWVGKNSAFVTTWYDQSGNDNHATQKNIAFQPRVINEGAIESLANGTPSLKMLGGATGGNGFNLPFNLSGVSDLSIITVLKQAGNLTIGNHIFGTNGPTGKTPGKLQIMYFSPNIFAVQSSSMLKLPVSPSELYSVRFKITSEADGTVQITAGKKTSATVSGLLTIPFDSSNPTLYRFGNAVYNRNFEGLSPEFIIYTNVLNDVDAAKLISGQNSFFGSK